MLKALYLLSLARNFSAANHDSIVASLGSLDALLSATEVEIKSLPLAASMLERLLDARAAVDLDAGLAGIAEAGIKLVGWGSEEYPELLAQVPGAPLLLYCKGNPEIMRSYGIAIVGSRKCSDHGKLTARDFGRELAELAIPMVSGMALGIDGAAHEGALEARGPTVAVLGCGVDVVYPPQHQELYERLCTEALVVSEYPPGTEPRKEHFPQRNRIISGLSKGTLVVEAPMGSGALITARAAIEQGRDVFAIPGPIRSRYSKGAHSLIKLGQAKLTENVDDILVEYGLSRAELLKQQEGAVQMELGAAAAGQADSAKAQVGPSAYENRLLELVSYEGTHVNDLVKGLGITTSECIAHLTMLEIKGLISSASGGYYIRL